MASGIHLDVSEGFELRFIGHELWAPAVHASRAADCRTHF